MFKLRFFFILIGVKFDTDIIVRSTLFDSAQDDNQ